MQQYSCPFVFMRGEHSLQRISGLKRRLIWGGRFHILVTHLCKLQRRGGRVVEGVSLEN
jgi:hypothetical protein